MVGTNWGGGGCDDGDDFSNTATGVRRENEESEMAKEILTVGVVRDFIKFNI